MMKPYISSTTADTATKAHWQMLAVLLFSASLFSGCQKEPEAPIETHLQNTAATPINAPESTVAPVVENNEPPVQTEVNPADIQDNKEEISTSATTNNPNNEAATIDPEQAVAGTQITAVHYKSAAGEDLSVVFETSATGILNAILTLPNQPKMTLSAPEGQGNNPTYRSADGNIELISHGGGSTIDLLQNGQLSSFEAISAEAEVVTQP